MTEKGFYIIKDSFFKKMNDPYLKGNKKENRPHYYCFKEDSDLIWMIPLSSKIEKYKKILNDKIKRYNTCETIHIIKLDNGKESVFLIQDMFPITKSYIKRKYTIANNHLKITSEHSAREIEKKAKKVMEMLKRNTKFTPTQPNINEIIKKLRK